MPVELASFGDLRLQVLKLNGGDKDADAIGVTSGIFSAPLVETVDIDNFESGDEG